MANKQLFVLMGVSGCGKSAIAHELARRTGWPMIEGDDYHPPANIAKMTAGEPLCDDDRMPWIDGIANIVNSLDDPHVLLACSALSGAVRSRLVDQVMRPCQWILLDVPEAILRQRLELRREHFMPSSLLSSQFAALEIPADALTVDGSGQVDQVCEAVLQGLDQRI